MSHRYLPIAFHPIKVLFVDDNKQMLIDLVAAISINYPYEIFDSSVDALHFISKLVEPNKEPKGDVCTEMTMDFILKEILQDGNRFNTCGVVVVDYDMPEINGLEFCRKINDFHFKKILLSGKADEKTAIMAFNQGIIDKYVTKHDPLVLDVLEADIRFLQKKYLFDFYQYAFNAGINEKISFMYESKFIEFLDKFCKKFNIIEYYYAFDEQAYILLNYEGEAYILKIAKTEVELQNSNDQIHRLSIDQQYYYSVSLFNHGTKNVLSYQKFVEEKNHKHASLQELLLCDQFSHQYSVIVRDEKICLTQREAQTLYYLLKGYTAKQMGVELEISARTIEDHVNQLKKKLNLPSKQRIVTSTSLDQILVV